MILHGFNLAIQHRCYLFYVHFVLDTFDLLELSCQYMTGRCKAATAAAMLLVGGQAHVQRASQMPGICEKALSPEPPSPRMHAAQLWEARICERSGGDGSERRQAAGVDGGRQLSGVLSRALVSRTSSAIRRRSRQKYCTRLWLCNSRQRLRRTPDPTWPLTWFVSFAALGWLAIFVAPN